MIKQNNNNNNNDNTNTNDDNTNNHNNANNDNCNNRVSGQRLPGSCRQFNMCLPPKGRPAQPSLLVETDERRVTWSVR